MKSRPLLIGAVVGIFVLSVIAVGYVGSHLTGKPDRLLTGVQYNRTWSEGQNYSRNGNYLAAIREYDKMVALRPNKVDGYTYRAIAEAQAGLYDRAVEDNTTGIELLTQRQGIEEQGNAADVLGMPYQDKLATVSEVQARLYHNRGYVYARRGEFERAVRDFKQAVALKPDAPVYHSSLSDLYQHMGQYGQDVENWKIATVSAPGDPASWTNYGWSLYCLGNLPEAMEANRHAAQMSVVSATARYNLGLLYSVEDQWAQAEPLYREALAINNTDKRERALGRVRDAMRMHPRSQALRKAEALLSAS
ncbi:MAG: tetratricopeptide repeat protein [Capsulimonas sp.]|uniref:tetratricopeptide repeat protein n=1 Tax=Capsulimonas sp. TaxID=2494211 RepID=UPI003267AC6B